MDQTKTTQFEINHFQHTSPPNQNQNYGNSEISISYQNKNYRKLMKLLKHYSEMIDPPPVKILYCYSEMNDSVIELMKRGIETHNGVPDQTLIQQMPKPLLLVLDDLSLSKQGHVVFDHISGRLFLDKQQRRISELEFEYLEHWWTGQNQSNAHVILKRNFVAFLPPDKSDFLIVDNHFSVQD